MSRVNLPINCSSGGSYEPAEWHPVDGWQNIRDAGGNEIYMLIREGFPLAFKVSVGFISNGYFSIDWGDGIIEHNRIGNNAETYQHYYDQEVGGVMCIDGYKTYKVRIFNATDDIYSVTFSRATQINGELDATVIPLLWIYYNNSAFNHTAPFAGSSSTKYFCYLKSIEFGFSTFSNLLTSISYFAMGASSLENVKFPDFSYITNFSDSLSGCRSLKKLILPLSLTNNGKNIYQIANECRSLMKIRLPDGVLTNITGAFISCNNLIEVDLSNNTLQNSPFNNLFISCTSLKKIIFPSSTAIPSNLSGMLMDCQSLVEIVNFDKILSGSSNIDFEYFLTNAVKYSSPIVINSTMMKLSINGSASFKMFNLTSIRINSGSSFSGYSPQINISYTGLDANALNLLFGDLPVSSGKTIKITGCIGAGTCDKSIATAKGWTVTV